MSISLLTCAYSYNFKIKIDGKNQEILAMKWFVRLSDGSWKTYQVTLYNASSKRKEKKLTYIQINNLEKVICLQNKSDTIKIKLKTKTTQEKAPNPLDIDREEHYIDPKGFVDSNDNLLSNGPFNYFKIQQYLRKYISKRLLEERPEVKKAEEKREKPEEVLPASVTTPALTSNTAPHFQKANKIQPISCRCNLKILAGIIFAIAAAVIANFYNTKRI